MSQEQTLAKIERFHERTDVPVGRDGRVSFGRQQTTFPSDEDSLVYIPVDKTGRKITWGGEPAKSAADYVYIVMSESGVRTVKLQDVSVFNSSDEKKAGFMVLSNNLLASARAQSSDSGKYEVRWPFLRFPSGRNMMLPGLMRGVARKAPDVGVLATFAFGWLDLVHYSAGKGIAYNSSIPLILVNPSKTAFPRSILMVSDVAASLYDIFAAPYSAPQTPSARVVDTTIVRRLSISHTIEITYMFDWAEFFKIEAFYYDRPPFSVRFAGECVQMLDEETGEALHELIRSPKYVVFFKEFPEMAVADRIVRQDRFDYGSFLQMFMDDPAMQPYASAVRRRVTLI